MKLRYYSVQKINTPGYWGPFCYLKQKRHDAPFNKKDKGKERRDERRFKLRQREEVIR